MSSNSRKVNYRLRLAKSIERKMMCTAFQKLAVLMPLSQYQYIGFGAYYFSDFYLFHKELGIKKMLSIEKGQGKQIESRFEFNKPFECIDLIFQDSSVALSALSWDSPKIMWLDYTTTLTKSVLADLVTALRNCKPGTSINITVKADAKQFDPDPIGSGHSESFNRLDVLKEVVGLQNVPREITNNQISAKTLTKVFTEILRMQIERILLERNLNETDLKFRQLFNFKYKDGVNMYTFGGIIYKESSQKKLLDKIEFSKLPFINDKVEPFHIDVPNLTIKEIKFLESIMPKGVTKSGGIKKASKLIQKNPMIPGADVLKFSKIYQYFPVFSETKVG